VSDSRMLETRTTAYASAWQANFRGSRPQLNIRIASELECVKKNIMLGGYHAKSFRNESKALSRSVGLP